MIVKTRIANGEIVFLRCGEMIPLTKLVENMT